MCKVPYFSVMAMTLPESCIETKNPSRTATNSVAFARVVGGGLYIVQGSNSYHIITR